MNGLLIFTIWAATVTAIVWGSQVVHYLRDSNKELKRIREKLESLVDDKE